jgi:hypothetical protein
LIDPPLFPEERISLIADIFSDYGEKATIKHLSGDDAKSFVDAIYEVIAE